MEAQSYDDIYVFDCPENHKLCYSCYHQSCETKMANGEILTCGICTHPLREGELNQLRLPREQIKKFQDYQMKKTLDVYSNQTRGVIKCPSQSCTWIAEANDPTERFRVQCPICKREFCSLCNEQYHYRTTCQQIPQITRQWFMWCEQGFRTNIALLMRMICFSLFRSCTILGHAWRRRSSLCREIERK